MNDFTAIIEDSKGNVIGVSTAQGDFMLKPEERFPRARIFERATALASKAGIAVPDSLKTAPENPAPRE